ncbi:MAG: hypothetical protein KKD07_03560 [Candidatus Omnitrophica bacterium]|nr:hypothetical protein [Candidatus Omnitrophota bacterium]MBU1997247.1 hypothetical protein [Candidatus Omnitrophota bacterium]MBU4333501.1 hypothetical protein [Candidatus Omnitrophota bacterium]
MKEKFKMSCRALCFVCVFVAIVGTVAKSFSPMGSVFLLGIIGLMAAIGWMK